MLELFNWICFISVGFLVMDLLLYFCKDAMRICDEGMVKKSRVLVKTNMCNYEEKIAK